MNELPSPVSEPKSCSSCGESFGCGAQLDSCWCSAVEVPAAAAERFRSNYADCLCPKCLVGLSDLVAIVVKYPDGRVEIIPDAVRVDTQNYHEGMFDLYDRNGTLLRQIDMGSGISWEQIGPLDDRSSTPCEEHP
jgi:hypothetical protein